MNSSGPISLGGTTPGVSIAIENGGPGTAQISLNDTAVRSLAGVPSGVITMPTDFYGKSNTVIINITIAGNTQNYDVWSAVSSNPTYSAGKTNATITINPGVTVGSASTGSYAMLVPAAFSPGDNVTIVNNGYIVGTGAGGGPGGSASSGTGGTGGTGGNALYVNRPTTVTNNNSIGAGGGGGGGGGGGFSSPRTAGGGGGGGGGGAGNNVGGGGTGGLRGGGMPVPSSPGSPGTVGSLATGGPGGGGGGGNQTGGPGGAGGSLGNGGSNGSPGNSQVPGGAPGPGGGTGNYITGNAFVTWPATGNRYGNVA
jgi:hypothetical protein